MRRLTQWSSILYWRLSDFKLLDKILFADEQEVSIEHLKNDEPGIGVKLLFMPNARWRNRLHCTAWPKINSHSQIFRLNPSIFCLPYRSKFSYLFDLCIQWVSVVRGAHSAVAIAQNPCRIQGLITMHPALLVSGAVIWHHGTSLGSGLVEQTNGIIKKHWP